jgi:hypothetical protein
MRHSTCATARGVRALCYGTACVSLVLAWAPRAWAVVPDVPQVTTSFNDVVRVVAYAGDTIYVGGAFTSATDAGGTHVRNHVAAIDASTGRLRRWNPDADAGVWSIAVSGDAVYLGGAFSRVGGVARRRLAEVSAVTGAVAGGFAHRPNGNVRAMTVRDGTLFVGGGFTAMDGEPRGRLAAFDVGTGDLRAGWTPAADGTVLTLAADGDRVYAGGRFTRVDGRSGTGFLAALSTATGDVLNAFDASIGYDVHDVTVAGGAVFAAADGPGGHLRAFRRDGSDLFDLAADGGLQGVTALDGTVYFGGHFDNVCLRARVGSDGSCRAGMGSRRKLAAVDAAGALTGWAPQADSSLGVVAVDSSASRVGVGGAFTRFRGGRSVQPRFAQFG